MADSYAAVTDVEAYAQMGAYTTTTKPTLAQVQGFLDSRAAELYGLLVEVMGDAALGPVGGTSYSQEIVTSTDRGFALNRALLQANAIGAAADALQAAGAGESPSGSQRVADLYAQYAAFFEEDAQLWRLAGLYVGNPRAATHLTDGVIAAATIDQTTEQGLVMTTAMEF